MRKSTPEHIYRWIQKRYDYYDNQDDTSAGDKYTKRVFREASVRFSKTIEEIETEYSKFIYDNTQPTVKKYVDTFHKELEKATELNEKKVKLDVDSIIKRKSKISSDKFIEFVESSRGKIFTAKTDPNVEVMYLLEEEGFWLFAREDLMEVDLGFGDGKHD